uniref:T9SS C-terminal target domain-containing protein n=1 Tax=Prevotella sp. GTC17253 TaxID=3236793 RepID=A0AB33ITD4_9BACT
MKLIMRTFISVLLCLFASLSVFSQSEVNLTPVAEGEGLVDGGLYFMTYKDAKGYWASTTFPYKDGFLYSGREKVNGSTKNLSYTSVSKAFPKSHILQFVEKSGRLYLKDFTMKKFVSLKQIGTDVICQYTDTINPNTYIQETKDKCFFQLNWTQSSDSQTLTFKFNETYHEFILSTSKTRGALLYKVENSSYTIDSDKPAEPINATVNVTFKRQFGNDKYNTLMLPFDIADYKNIFGTSTTVFKVANANNNQIQFISLEDNEAMHAYQPYIIKGNFDNQQLFTINGVTINVTGEKEHTEPIGDFVFHGVLTTQNIGKQNAHILKDGEFLNCSNTNTITINPYRWYITHTEENAASKAMKITISGLDTATNINHSQITNGGKEQIYNLQGIKINTQWQQLPKGIYIINGKTRIKY